MPEKPTVELSPFAQAIFTRTYAFTPGETWPECARRVAKAVAADASQEAAFEQLIRDRVFIPGGRYLYSCGRPIQQVSNCFGLSVGDSREEWSRALRDTIMCLSMGGGVGVEYSNLRPKDAPIGRMGGKSSGPLALMQMVNEVGRYVLSGGTRRSAIWAGLSWRHPDVADFITVKDWDEDTLAMKAKRFEAPAPLDMTNVSVVVDNGYLDGLRDGDPTALKLHAFVWEHMARTGEPAFRNQALIEEDDRGAITGNPCQEAVLHDRDSCNLGSIVLPRIKNLAHLEAVTRLAVQFLYNGSLRADYPTSEIAAVAARNRRIGLGIMGLHEFMLIEGHRYEWFEELGRWLNVWQGAAADEARRYARKCGGPTPITTRAIAPTGTISIIAETTSGLEPVFCSAYKRRYLVGGKHYYRYVVDPTAARFLTNGGGSLVEDAYALAADFERRLEVQAKVQEYVDQAISSTVNLPAWGEPGNDDPAGMAATIARYLPRLKGLTVYPNNARPGQPLVPVDPEMALREADVVFEEEGECRTGVCGL